MSSRNPPAAGCVQSFVLRREEARFAGYLAGVDAEAYPRLAAEADAVLHPDEAAYFRRVPSERRRSGFLLGRYAAKAALAARWRGAEFAKINIAFGVFKNPVVCFPTEEPWAVSITHTDALAGALAFPAVHPMALDVETVDAERARTMASQCAAAERSELARRGLDDATACTLVWTAKEAVSKVIGTGMMCSFELLETMDVERREDGSWRGLFKALAQYQFRSWIQGETVLTLALPKRTEIEFEGGSPRLSAKDAVAGRATR